MSALNIELHRTYDIAKLRLPASFQAKKKVFVSSLGMYTTNNLGSSLASYLRPRSICALSRLDGELQPEIVPD